MYFKSHLTMAVLGEFIKVTYGSETWETAVIHSPYAEEVPWSSAQSLQWEGMALGQGWERRMNAVWKTNQTKHKEAQMSCPAALHFWSQLTCLEM